MTARDAMRQDTTEEMEGWVPIDARWKIANGEIDDILDEMIELFNARDFESLHDLLNSEVESRFLGETAPQGVVTGLETLALRYPTLVLTRGDLGLESVVAAWLFDQEVSRYDLVGYLVAETDDTGLIERLDYVEELPDSDDVVLERPEPGDLPEWEDWSTFEEG